MSTQTRRRVYAKKRPRVYWHHAHMFQHACTLCPRTRVRFERTHGDVLNGHTGFFSVSHHTPHTPHTTRHNTTRRQTEKEDRQRKKRGRKRRRQDTSREKREESRLWCVSRLIEGTYLAILVRRWDLTHPPPTINDSQPDLHLKTNGNQLARKKTKTGEKKRGKKEKEGPKGCHPRWAQKLIFYIRTVKRNRNEIEAHQKISF